jgi:pilus assembly protein CpaF
VIAADLSVIADEYRGRVRRELAGVALGGPAELRGVVERRVRDLLLHDRVALGPGELEVVIASVVDDTVGLGPLDALLADPAVTEIIVNGASAVYAERHGRLTAEPVRFRDEQHLRDVIDRIVGSAGRRVDEASPMADARLPDGSRVNAVLPPLAVDGPLLAIRKFSRERLTVPALVASGSLDGMLAERLRRAVRGRLNIVVSGGTGTGKTTLLNALAGFADPVERIVTVEDAAELRLDQPHVARLEARPASLEGRGEVTVRALVRNALRMRPDRIVVGEVRGPEALDMLQAMNTGHDGSLTTVHVGSPAEALRRIETMVLMAGLELPHAVVRENVALAVDVVVHVIRSIDGRRTVAGARGLDRGQSRLVDLDDMLLETLIEARCSAS